MSRFLIQVLKWSGGASALVFLFPGLIIFAGIALIVPGLVLAAMPTIFIYTLAFSLFWFGLSRMSAALAILAGSAAVAGLAAGFPILLNSQSEQWIEQAARTHRSGGDYRHPARGAALAAGCVR
jgi:hypothetical protein